MSYVARHNFARISPRKARLVIDMIRGKKVDAADAILRLNKKRAAVFIHKVLKSAQANAIDGGEESVRDLFISKAWVDEGPMHRRWRPRARGSATPELHRRSHINIELDVKAE